MTLSERDLLQLFGFFDENFAPISSVQRLTTEQIVTAAEPMTLLAHAFPTLCWPDEVDAVITCCAYKSGYGLMTDDIRFATFELLKNAAGHGNRWDPTKIITVTCGWVVDGFYCSIQDQGTGFDIAQPEYAGKTSPGRGLGLLSVREHVDSLYNFLDPGAYFCKRLA